MRDILFIKTGTVHAGVQFDMYGETLDPVFFQCLVEIFQNVQGVDFRFQVKHDHVVKSFPFGVHDSDGNGDARGTQFDSLVGKSDHEIIHPMVL